MKPDCIVPDCGRPSRARQYCTKHYQRFKRHGDPLGKGVLGAPKGRGVAQAFLAQLLSKPALNDECVLWPFSVSNRGYGCLRVDGVHKTVHRMVCKRWHGEPDVGMQAAHKCGNPRCVSSRHLSWKTPEQNQHDRRAHKTAGWRLKEDDVRRIRIRLAEGASVKTLCAEYDVSRGCIEGIKYGRRWTWLE